MTVKIRLAAAVATVLNLTLAGTTQADALTPSNGLLPTAEPYANASPEQLAQGLNWALNEAPNHLNPLIYNPNDPFYIPPKDLPATPGSVMRTQPVPHPFNIAGPSLPGYAEKFLYTTTDINGTPVAASGFVMNPINEWKGKGPTPTVVIPPGTRGSADACAPSRGVGLTASVQPATLSVSLNYELPFYYLAAMYGMRVIVPDYIGLGTPGAHTFVVNPEHGTATLDAARAGLATVGAPKDSPLGIWGYSQGGGAAGAAAELADTYAPELNLKGTYAGAPVADLSVIMQAVDGSFAAGLLGFAINSYSARFPEFKAEMNKHLNERGKKFVRDTAQSCFGDGLLKNFFADTSTMTVKGITLAELARTNPVMQEIFHRVKLGNSAPSKPIMVGGHDNDDLIAHSQVVQMARDYCSKGGEVYFAPSTFPALTFHPDLNIDHVTGMVESVPTSFNYLVDRFNDQPAPNNCGSF